MTTKKQAQAEKHRQRLANAKERGRKLVAAAQLRAKKLVTAARLRARRLVDAVRQSKIRPTVKEGRAKPKRKAKTKSVRIRGKGEHMPEASFAEQVLKVVRSNHPKKFGDKAFIASVWDVNFAPHTPFAAFKRKLVAAHKAGELELSRADLVSAMDPVMVERSETRDGIATYHFIRPEPRAQPKAPKAKAAATTIADAAKFRRALDRVALKEKEGALLSVKDVRAQAKLSKPVFDSIALNLASRGIVVLHYHDFPSSLSAKERAEYVEDERGTVYIGIAPGKRAPVEPYQPRLTVGETILAEVKAMGGTREKPVRIPALRKRLPRVGPLTFDRELGQLQVERKVILYRDDNNATAETEGAWFVAGEPRHILYLR